jgi:amidohydrolase
MRNFAVALSLAGLLAVAPNARPQDLDHIVSGELPDLVSTYRDIHAHPELSRHEEATAARLAAALRQAGYTVAEHVGRYPDGSPTDGVVAVLKNGAGPFVLLRTELDALPVVEETGLPYASRVTTQNAAGVEVGVMHACGHDIHITNMIGTARALAALRSKWRGTVMLVGQPAEETVEGAKAMLAGRLYERFGTPDFAVALHDTNDLAAGQVGITSGPTLAGVTSIDVTLRGIGGHGAQPQNGKDPVVMAGEFITQLQTIVSRQEDPRDPAVVTIGSIHGGTKRNVIPNEVKMELTTRAYSEQAMRIIVEGVKRTARGVALSVGVPPELEPIVTVLENESSPATINDPALTRRVKGALVKALGHENVIDAEPIMASEDFGLFGLEGHKIPTVMFWLGAMDPAKLAAARSAGKSLPGLHTSRFEPLPEPTLRTGVIAMTSVAVALLQR